MTQLLQPVDRLTVGRDPLELFLRGLVPGYGWYYGLRTRDGSSWPAGTGAEFKFTTKSDDIATAIVWPAAVTDDKIVWDMTAEAVIDLQARAAGRADLAYITSQGRRIPWGVGRL